MRLLNVNENEDELDFCKSIDASGGDDLKQAKITYIKNKTQAFLIQLFNMLEIEEAGKRIINPEKEYVVKFTPELLKKIREHDVRFLLDNNTGDYFPTLYDYTEKGFGGQIRLRLKESTTPQDIANLQQSA